MAEANFTALQSAQERAMNIVTIAQAGKALFAAHDGSGDMPDDDLVGEIADAGKEGGAA